jgi:selenocysteine lyase/cysteine desulfurase
LGYISSDELGELRRLFPHTEKKIFFNHAAVSPLSLNVTEGMRTFIEDRSFGRIDDFEHSMSIMQETKELIGKLIGAGSNDIALMKNTSEGLNVIANGISWREGDRILLNDREFPSNVYPFLNLSELGVEVDFAECRDGRIELETLEESLTQKTRLLSISHVSFLSGFRVDLEKLSMLCRSKGVYLSVDAIQSVGVVPVDASEWGFDFLSCGGHKWLMAPLGTGFLYVKRELLDVIRPVYVSWLSMKNPFDLFRYEPDLRDDAGRFEYSAPNMIGIVGMKHAVRLLLDVGIERIESHVLSLLAHLEERLFEIGIESLSSFPPHESSGISLLRVPNADALFKELTEKNISVSVREDALRVSPHFYNSPDEIEMLVAVIKNFL